MSSRRGGRIMRGASAFIRLRRMHILTEVTMLVAFVLAFILPLPAQAQPPRDRVIITIDPSTREAELQKRIEATPTGVAAYLELAKLQEARGSNADAEATLMRARQAAPTNKDVVAALARLYNRQGSFSKTMEMLDARSEERR